MTSGQNESGQSSGSQSGTDGESLLADVDLSVPFPPDLGGSEHPTAPAHVTEGTLACTMSTTTRHTRNTRYSSASTPRLGRGLFTGKTRNSVWLTLVLGHGGMDIVNHIGADG